MTLKNKIYFTLFTILEFVGVLFLLLYMAVSSLAAGEEGSEGTTLGAGEQNEVVSIGFYSLRLSMATGSWMN